MPENTIIDDGEAGFGSVYTRALYAVVTVLVYLFGLRFPLVGPDEPRYAQVAREMFERGDWVTPTLGGHTWFEKPALLYWLEMAAFSVFGVTEFAARLGPALFGLATIASLYILGRIAFPARRSFADLLAVTAATTLGLLVFSRGASFDIILTLPVTAAMTAFYAYEKAAAEDTRRKNGSLLIFYVFIGVALLAKGLVGIVLPGAMIAAYHAMERRWPRREMWMSSTWGGIVAIAVAAVWYVPVYLQNGYVFIYEFFVQHHFQRYLSNKFQHPQPFYFFLWILPLMVLPWVPALFLAAYRGVRGLVRRRDGVTADNSLSHLAWAWVLVPLAFFSFSGSKLPGYILPAVPGAVILCAIQISRLLSEQKGLIPVFHLVAVGVLAAVIAVSVFVLPSFADGESVKAMIAAADAGGHSAEKVFSMHHPSHNAEFYAAGRLYRNDDGTQKIWLGPAEVAEQMRKEGSHASLVIIPREYEHQLFELKEFAAETILRNDESALVAVKLQP